MNPGLKQRKRPRLKRIAQVGELEHGQSKKFALNCGGARLEGMLINFNGEYFAYVNSCRHIGISLDWIDNHFFTEDNRYLICANHGALYEPKSGECIWGPCAGASLRAVPLEIEQESIFARCPEGEES